MDQQDREREQFHHEPLFDDFVHALDLLLRTEAIKNRLRLSKGDSHSTRYLLPFPPASIIPNLFTEPIDATGGNLNSADMTDSANHSFARREYVYYYPRPRRNLLAVCVWICVCITCWQNESLPSNDQEAGKTYVANCRLSG